jgi:hypothetical protein
VAINLNKIIIINMLLGFSDGVMHKKFINKLDRYKTCYLDKYFFNSIEMHCVDESIMDFIINDLNKKLYSKFKYISLHTPSFYKENEKNIVLLKKIKQIYKKFDIKNIVIHPNQITNWDILDNFLDLPLSIENMDSDKHNFTNINDFTEIIYKKNLKITLDLNHIYDNDKSLKLAEAFQNKFKKEIVEYHVSGYNKKDKHVPIFKTKQVEILKTLKFKNLPVIIESDFNNFLSIRKEYNFINKYLNN